MSNKKKSSDDDQYYQRMTLTGFEDIEPEKVNKPSSVITTKKDSYTYIGPVYRYNICVIDKFEVKTQAVSEAQAINNVLYRAKKKLGLSAGAGGIKLKGTIYKDEDWK